MNTDNLKKFDLDKFRKYTNFMSSGGLKNFQKSYSKIKNFLNNKDSDYLEGLKLELENSFFNRYIFYPRTYSLVCKKLEKSKEKKKNLADMFYTMSLTK
jgi:hypothetical protein